MTSYSCDSTPLQTRESFVREWQAGSHLTRWGRQSGHYDIQRVWLRSGSEVAVLFNEPLRLREGTATCLFQAFLCMIRHLRQLGHRGLCIVHHVEDGALFSAMHRLFLQHSASVDAEVCGAEPRGEGALLSLLHWQVSSGCICHDIHNSMT